jgi:hypothetical protein
MNLGYYGTAFVLLFRNPALVIAPLIMALLTVLLFRILPGDGPLGGINTGIGGLLASFFDAFGLSVSLILADYAWRARGTASFEKAWQDGRRKLPEILMAALGLNFVLWAAAQIGGTLGGFGALILGAVALYFLIYTLPAAAIGGIPGGAAIQSSIDRVRGAPIPALLLAICYVLAFYVAQLAVGQIELSSAFPLLSVTAYSLIAALAKAIAAAYVALVLAKGYADVAFGRY